jgi:DNA-binding NarL/FixJ family response regulator
MLRLVLATIRLKALQAFAAALSSDPEVRLQQVASGAAALEAARSSNPDLVIIDADLPDTPPLDLVQKLLLVNAMVNTAVVSPLADAEFHEASEGLGILGSLPLEPGRREAVDLLLKLRKVLGRVG